MLHDALDGPGAGSVRSGHGRHRLEVFRALRHIADAINTLGGTGLWDEEDGFYYDQMHADGHDVPLRLRSIVGLVPLLAVVVLPETKIDPLPGFHKRLVWFLRYRQDLARRITYMEASQRTATATTCLPSRLATGCAHTAIHAR